MVITGINIFLTWKQYEQIMTDEVKLKMLDLPALSGTSFEKIEKLRNKILYDETRRQMATDERSLEFINSWMKFNITGVEAKENTWNLLSDFCSKNKDYYLKNNDRKNDFLSSNQEIVYPIGKTFSIIHNSSEIKNLFGKVIKKSTQLEVLINTQLVIRLEGEFKTSFTIYFTNMKMIFGTEISIYPL